MIMLEMSLFNPKSKFDSHKWHILLSRKVLCDERAKFRFFFSASSCSVVSNGFYANYELD